MRDRLKFTFPLLLSVLFLLPLYVIAQSNIITHLTVKKHRNFVRLWIKSSKQLNFSKMYLEHKPRFVIDANDTYLSDEKNIVLWPNLAVNDIRYAYKKNNRLRIVFDLRHQFEVKTRIVSPRLGHKYLLIADFKKPTLQSRASAQLTSLKKKVQNKSSRLIKYVKKLPSRNIVIVIDPGHGGKDPGAIGRHGTREKEIVLKVAKSLQHKINQHPGYTAILTRKNDSYLPLRNRLEQARKYHADMFVAIHADAYLNNDARGASVYALSLRGSSSEAARWLAKKENESELVGGLDLADKSMLLKSVLLNLSQTATLRASIKIGRRIIEALSKVSSLHQHKVEQAAFVVLKSPDIPSLLVETGFISNPLEERKLNSDAYQARIAVAIKQGIINYFNEWPPRGTKLYNRNIVLAQNVKR